MPEAKVFDELQKMYNLPDQQEVNYNPAGQQPNKACSNCRFFIPADNWDDRTDRCHLISNWPEPITPNGLCDRHEIKAPKVDLGTPIAVVIVEPIFDYDDSESMALSMPKSIVERVKDFAKSLRAPTPEPMIEQPAFKVFKMANGRNAWIARHTGKWIDREKEILADKAHDRFVTNALKGVFPMPELWMWHNKATKHGQAVAVWKSGGFVLAAGYFDDNAVGQRAFEYYERNAGKIKLSHMFNYPHESKIDGVFYDYRTIEITTLPDGAEAFPYTSFQEVNTMALPEIAERMIEEALGKDVLEQARAADSKAAADSKTLDGQGIASKGLDAYDQAQAAEKAALETRLKANEEAVKGIPDLMAAVTSMNDSIKLLTEKLDNSEAARATELAKVNDLEKKLLEYSDLKPPASQSDDTLLNQREKTLVDSMITLAQKGSDQSLIEKLMGGQPTIHS